MIDAELRGRLLSHFYKLRNNNEGIVPVTEEILSGGEPVSREAIAGVCREMADVGLIKWGPHLPPGHIIGSARIRGPGVDAVERGGSASIDIRFPNAGRLELPNAPNLDMKETNVTSTENAYTPEAAKAVYEAIQSLTAAGKRAYSLNVPLETENILVRNRGGRLSRTDASAQARAAIIGLATSGKIEAHVEPRNDWLIKEPLEPQGGKVMAPIPKIFIVHGHDNEAKAEVARFIERLGFQPLILHEQVSKGRTVIEKFEANSDVGFAVVLLTPDDEGSKKGQPAKPRARQNVVLELGYFVGRLGRDRVCALRRGEVEIPSDFNGVVYETYDEHGAWRGKLAKELEAAKFAIDWAKVHA